MIQDEESQFKLMFWMMFFEKMNQTFKDNEFFKEFSVTLLK